MVIFYVQSRHLRLSKKKPYLGDEMVGGGKVWRNAQKKILFDIDQDLSIMITVSQH